MEAAFEEPASNDSVEGKGFLPASLRGQFHARSRANLLVRGARQGSTRMAHIGTSLASQMVKPLALHGIWLDRSDEALKRNSSRIAAGLSEFLLAVGKGALIPVPAISVL